MSIGGLGFQAHSQHTFLQEWPPHLKLVGINGSDWDMRTIFYTSKIGEQSDRMPSKTWPDLPIKVMSIFYFIKKHLFLWPSAPANVDHIQGKPAGLPQIIAMFECISKFRALTNLKEVKHQFPADVWKVFEYWDIPRLVVSSFFGLSQTGQLSLECGHKLISWRLLRGIMSHGVALYHPIVKLSFNNLSTVLSHNFGVFVVETYLSTSQLNMDPFL